MNLQIAGKILGGLLGYLAFGVAGLLFGLVLGHAFDKGLLQALKLSGPEAANLMRTQFFETTFTLLGYVAKADGQVSKAEIQEAEGLFQQLRLNPQQRRKAIEHFQRGAVIDFDPEQTITKFKDVIGPRRHAQQTLIAFLLGIAMVDGELSSSEQDAVYHVAALLRLPRAEVDRVISLISAQYQFQHRSYYESENIGSSERKRSELDLAYRALGADPSLSDNEIKRRYRKLMSENHPDKLIAQGVPDELLRVSTERSQEITAAYQIIQNRRGMK